MSMKFQGIRYNRYKNTFHRKGMMNDKFFESFLSITNYYISLHDNDMTKRRQPSDTHDKVQGHAMINVQFNFCLRRYPSRWDDDAMAMDENEETARAKVNIR